MFGIIHFQPNIGACLGGKCMKMLLIAMFMIKPKLSSIYKLLIE